MLKPIQEKGCKHNQARQSRRLTAMPRVLIIYLKRMAWDKVNKGSGEQEGKNIKVKQFTISDNVLFKSDKLIVAGDQGCEHPIGRLSGPNQSSRLQPPSCSTPSVQFF